MGSATLVSVSEYLATSYHPDREYIDGRILERTLGEKDHGIVQTELAVYLATLRKSLGIQVIVEQRVQVKPDRFRVPDVCVIAGPMPNEQIFTSPPFVCIEVLSKDDSMQDMQDRIDDYLAFGVPYVWILNPRNRRAYACTPAGIAEAKDGHLRAHNPDITIPLAQIFTAL